jgi:DNA-binding IclR family transcriptional regulator
MTILTSVSDGLALLVSGAAMATATLALRRTRPQRRVTPAALAQDRGPQPREQVRAFLAGPERPKGFLANPEPAEQDRPPVPGSRSRGGATREQVRAFLADPQRAGSDWSLVQVSQGVGRSSATVSYALDKLVKAGEVELTSAKPRRYTITPSGATPLARRGATQAASGSAPEAAGSANAAAHPQTSTRSRAGRPAAGDGEGSIGRQARGDALREQIRAWLADHPGQSLSLVEVSSGVGRRTATVAYALDKLISAGQVELTNPKPRRYAITPQGASPTHSQPTIVPDPQPTPAPAQAAAARRAQPAADQATSTGAAPHSPGERELGEEIRDYLAGQPGEHLSPIDIAHGTGRPSATVKEQLQRLVDAGQIRLVSDKPRRFTVPAPASDATQPQPAAGSRPRTAVAPSTSAAPQSAAGRPRAAKPTSSRTRKPANGSRSKTTAAATGKVAAAGK